MTGTGHWVARRAERAERRAGGRFAHLRGWALAAVAFSALGATGCGEDEPTPAVVDAAPVDAGLDMEPDAGEPSVDERCPEAQAGTYLLVLYPDRVEAWRQRQGQFGATYMCEFLALGANGITNATGLVRGRTGDRHFYVTSPEATEGAIYAFDEGGAFVGKVMNNINLQGVAGIWPTAGDDYVAYSGTSQNLYRLNADFQFRGPASLPQLPGAQLPGLVDLVYNDATSAVAVFSDRSPRLFKDPFSPEWAANELGAGGAVTLVDTEEGAKVLIAARLGAGAGTGVVLHEAINSGRTPPPRETVLVPAGEIEDAASLVIVDTGFFVLDRGPAEGPGRIHGFNGIGVRQSNVALRGTERPLRMLRESIFSRF